MKYLLPLLFLLGCGKLAARAPTPAVAVADPTTYSYAVNRLGGFSENGWIVSHDANGVDGILAAGDSLLFSGLALYALPCADGMATATALQAMLGTGMLVRYPGDTADGPVSLDQVLGLYRGISARIGRCGDKPSSWAGLESVSGQVDLAGFEYVRDLLLSKLGLSAAPPASEQAELETVAVAWSGADVLAKQPCYRVHLSLIALQTIEELGGKVSANSKNAFCAATSGADLPTVDAWCGRTPVSTWLNSFTYNTWQYRHQRCPAWESPDGGGDTQPAVDFLVGYADSGASLK